VDIVYPLYLVIDASASMKMEVNGKTRIDLARQIPLALLRLYEEDNSIVSAVQVSIITFNSEAKCVLELGEIQRLRSLPLQFEAQSKTFFGKAFDEIYERINADYKRLSGANKFMKPTVVIVTDGGPNDEAGDRNSAFRRLVPIDKNTGRPDPNAFALWPQIIMLGIDAASEKALQLFSHRNETYYKADDAMSVDQQIAKIAKKVKDAVSSSMAEPETNPDEPWVDWLTENDDDAPSDLFDF
jgi:hypothetical protein